MTQLFLSLLTGALCGVVFAALKLPIPAPPVMSGIFGIIGIYAGYNLLSSVMK
jgi:XapX domain-containing protein